MSPLVLAGLGITIGAAIAITFNVVRARREKNRTKRREQLKSLCRRFGTELLGDHVPTDLVDAAARFRGEVRGVDLDDVMIGTDREGKYWLARRRVGRESHQVFGFEIRGELNVRGLHVEPRPSVAPRKGWRRWLPQEKLDTTTRLRMHVRWEAEARRFEDKLARQAVDRWIATVAESCQASGKTPIGLEVHCDRAWVHSLVTLEGVAQAEFLRRALEVRQQVLDEVRRRPATLKTHAVRENAEDQARRRVAKEDTRPLFAVGKAEGVQAGEDSEEKTVMLSAADLLREVPDPRSKRVRKRAMGDDDFEIPEPEEVVTLIRAR